MKPLVECKSVPINLPEASAAEVDEVYATLPQECKNAGIIHKSFEAGEYEFAPGERAEISIVTTPTVDAVQEVVLCDGLLLEPFRKHGCVLWDHKKDQPIGRSQWIKKVGDSIKAKTEYPPHPKNEAWQIDYVYELVQTGVLKGKSIGFLPLEPKSEPTAEEIEQHPDWANAGIWRKSFLLEYSVVITPCCFDALVEVCNTKSLDVERLKELGIEVPIKLPEPQPEPVVVALAEPVIVKEDDCVSKKIKEMHDAGETAKYSDQQIMAIAYSHCHSKCLNCKPKQKRKTAEQIVAEILSGINLDPARIAEKARQLHRDRGRV